MELRKKTVNTLLYLFIYFPIIFLILQFANMILNLNVTKIYEFIIIALILININTLYNKIAIFFLLIITLIHSTSGFGINNFNMAYKFILVILIVSFFTNITMMTKFKNYFNNKINSVIKYINIIQILMLVSLLIPTCYINKWGESRYFQGPFDSPHQLGYFLLGIIFILLYLYIKYDYKISFIWMNINVILVLFTGVRTVLVGVIFLFLFALAYYLKKSKRNIFITFCVSTLVIGVVFGTDIANDIPMITKMKYTGQSEYTNISSGRDLIWKNNLDAYKELPVLKKIIGAGMGVTFKINYETIGKNIWAHNDIIQILLSYGLIGVFIYLSVLLRLFYRYKNILIFTFLTAIMILNGFLNYNNLVLMLPFMLLNSKVLINSNT